ncbi:MAG TPA: SagB/ThcOx family dehydrogenase [Thermodesulfobacteriota bacterium]|nr:SagB/ThcOx family dehydrogenase [Thermodesulfobacteriota bacterium]
MFERWIGMILFLFIGAGLLEIKNGYASMSLPTPSSDGKVSLEKAIKERRTIRDFRERTLSLNHLSQLLWAAQGITDPTMGRRAAPSGGALYPLDIYILIGENGVEKMEAGIYHYLPKEHSVSVISKGDRRREISSASLSQMWMAKAPVIFIITAEYKRVTGKYGERGVRYALIEVGHASQNLFLEAEALGLGAGIVGAFNDLEVSKMADLPPKHEPLLIMPVGYKR